MSNEIKQNLEINSKKNKTNLLQGVLIVLFVLPVGIIILALIALIMAFIIALAPFATIYFIVKMYFDYKNQRNRREAQIKLKLNKNRL